MTGVQTCALPICFPVTIKAKIRAFDWSEPEEYEPNFEWRDYKVEWYKYLGRGMTANRPIKPDEIAEMLEDCLKAIRKLEKPL